MPARAALMSRAHEPDRRLAELPHAREVLLPELLAGCAGAPLEWARRFHRFFFDVAELAIEARGLIVLQDVVIGRPSPVLREIQLWGATLDADDLLRMSPSDIALQVGIAPEVQALICTGSAAVRWRGGGCSVHRRRSAALRHREAPYHHDGDARPLGAVRAHR